MNMMEWTELSLFMDALGSKVKIVSSVFNKKHVFKNIRILRQNAPPV